MTSTSASDSQGVRTRGRQRQASEAGRTHLLRRLLQHVKHGDVVDHALCMTDTCRSVSKPYREVKTCVWI